ncbi:MAG: hypothetical protein ABS955_01915 [Stenotrophomonas maltophilia]
MKNVLITGGSPGMGVILTYNAQAQSAQAVVERSQTGGGTAVALQLDVGHNSSFAGFAAQVAMTLQAIWNTTFLDGLLGRAGEPGDVGRVIAGPLSDEQTRVSPQSIEVAGDII